jgi:hypothetical protein
LKNDEIEKKSNIKIILNKISSNKKYEPNMINKKFQLRK